MDNDSHDFDFESHFQELGEIGFIRPVSLRDAARAVVEHGVPDEVEEAILTVTLKALQSDSQAYEWWENMRLASGSNDERTVMDLTTDDIRGFFRWMVYQEDHNNWLDSEQLPFEKLQRFDADVQSIERRLIEGGFIKPAGEVTASFYFLLLNALDSLAGMLNGAHYHEEAAVLEQGREVVRRAFVTHVNLGQL